MDLGIGAVSNDVVHSNDVQRYTTNVTYTKVKEVVSLKNLKGLRVAWEFMAGAGGGDVESKLYVNGVAAGVEHSTSSTSMVAVYDDIADIDYGDLIQIYAKKSGDANVYVENMKIKFKEFTTQDP